MSSEDTPDETDVDWWDTDTGSVDSETPSDSSESRELLAEFHDEAWEAEMREVLSETDHDTELGIQMAKDAQRLVAGDLSETEFYKRYHEAVVDEFGVDDRPIETHDDEHASNLELLTGTDRDGPGLFSRLADAETDSDVPRREVMKKAGAGAALLGGGVITLSASEDRGRVAAASDEADDDDDVQWGMVIDLEKCDGCLACVTACKNENNTSVGAHWMYVFTYEESDQDTHNFLVRPCQHCSNAPCEKVCPTTARHTRSEDGIVLTDYDVCIGCRYCQVACPYGVNYFQWGEPDTPQEDLDPDHVQDERGKWVDSRPPKGVMGKCTMCPSRQDGHRGEDKIGTAACEDACAMDAIHFGDMNDSESTPRQYLDRVTEERPNDQQQFPNRPDDTVSTFRLLEAFGTEPNVVYVGNEPGENAEQVDGPVKYEDLGLVDRRKEVLDDGTFGGGVV